MNSIFQIVYDILMIMLRLTGFTYKEINIIVYFVVIPFIYFILLDKMIKKIILKLRISWS